MKYPIDAYTWRVLRFILRETTPAGQRDVPAVQEIRHEVGRSRKSKTKAFWDHLVEIGLLRRVGKLEDTSRWGNVPEYLLMQYVLTTAGGEAAEYGEYEADPHNNWKAIQKMHEDKTPRQKGMDTLFVGKGPQGRRY